MGERRHIVVPWWKPAVIAIGFTLYNVSMSVGGGSRAVPGIIVLVLSKCIIPFSMLLNMPRCSLGLKYSKLHWASMGVLMGGIVLTVFGPLRKAFETHVLSDKVNYMI